MKRFNVAYESTGLHLANTNYNFFQPCVSLARLKLFGFLNF